MRLSNSKVVKTTSGNFHRVLETRKYIFFINFEVEEKNRSVRMFNRKRELLADDKTAYDAFKEATSKENEHQIWWISDKLK